LGKRNLQSGVNCERRLAAGVVRCTIWAVWRCIRVLLLLFLAILEPVVSLVLGSLALLSILMTFLLVVSWPATFPHCFDTGHLAGPRGGAGRVPRTSPPDSTVDRQVKCRDTRNGRDRPSLCENARAPFSGVHFSHVDAISGDFSRRIRPLAILRGERKVFSHNLGHKQPLTGTPKDSTLRSLA
jgi:hypothetical protein